MGQSWQGISPRRLSLGQLVKALVIFTLVDAISVLRL